MNLIVFDIDGTIVDSVEVDDFCFKQSFQQLHNIDIDNADWSNFKHVTDSGLTHEIFEAHYGIAPTASQTLELKTCFYQLVEQRIHEITEIKGAKKTLHSLMDNPEFSIAFATGGWRETATLKLSAIGFELREITLVSANEHVSRSEITRLAIDNTLAKVGLDEFSTITYVGDGLWDYKTTRELGINFIGIDSEQNNELVNAGAMRVMPNLEDIAQIMSWAKSSR